MPIAFCAMLEAKPVRFTARTREAPSGDRAATVMLACVAEHSGAVARHCRHAFGEFERFVTHSGLIGPTKAGWSFGCLLMTVELTSRPTRLNCSCPSISWLRTSFR